MSIKIETTSTTAGVTSITPAGQDALAMRGDSVLSGGIAVMYLFMNLLAGMADQKYSQMTRQADISRNTQEQANKVDAVIAGMSKPDDKETLPVDVINYMRDNNIYMTGKDGQQQTIDDWLQGTKEGAKLTKSATQDQINQDQINAVKLDKGELTAVKAALDNVSNRTSDFVSQSQLQIQKIMQSYNVTVSLINSMQSMLAEMNKSIAKSIG